MNLRGGDRKSTDHDDCLKLDDLGITQNQSTRWQLEAQLSEEEFEKYLRNKRAEHGEIVAADVIRLARKNKQPPQAETQKPLNAAEQFADSTSNSNPAPLPPPRPSKEVQQLKLPGVLAELNNHCTLLDNILRPLYSGRSSELHIGERRVLGHLMGEIQSLLDQLQTFSD